MERSRLENFVGGWIVGDFSPTIFRTDACEVAVKHYQAGSREPAHHHKVADELTLIASGRARMSDLQLEAGDIVVVRANESTDFEAIDATVTVVVKLPSVPGDKYPD
jgi:mannose-6-phosphate isomerase-like protein (cupin superfamily)